MNKNAMPPSIKMTLGIMALVIPLGSFAQQKPSLDSLYYSVPDSVAPIRSTEKGLPFSELQNPQFNDLDQNNQPDGWQIIGSPELRSEAGNTYARVSSSHHYRQALETTLEPQHLTFAPKVRGQFGNEISALFTYQEVDPTFSFYQRNRAFLQEEGWTQVYFGVERLDLPDGEFTIIPSTNDQMNWIDLDDMYLLKSGFQNGDLESLATPPTFDWQFESASLATGILSPNGIELLVQGSATQITSATWGSHQYFVTADVAGSSPSLSLTDEYLDLFGEIVATEIVNATTPKNGEWLVQYSGSNTLGIQASKVSIKNESNGNIVADNLTRGYTLVSPSLFNPDDSAVETELEFLFVWPEQNMTGRIEIISPNGTIFDTIENLSGTDSFLAKYDPAINPIPGIWKVRFDALNAAGKSILLEHEFTILEPEALIKPQAYLPDRFDRISWTWLLNVGDTEPAIRAVLESVKQDHFTKALVFANGNQWQTVAAVCEDIDLPFIAADFDIQNLIKGIPARNEKFSAESYRRVVRQELGDALQSSAYEGLYIIDEPFGVQEAEDTLAVSKIVASTPEFKRQYLTFSTSVERAGLLEEMQPPMYWTTNYPINTLTPNLKQNLIDYANTLAFDIDRASAANRPYYLVGQSFSSPDFFLVGPPGFVRANLGIALTYGIDGVMLFIHNRINSFEGIRDENNQYLQNTKVWAEEFERLEVIEALLSTLTRLGGVARNSDYMWSVFSNGDGDRFLALVSLDSRRPTVAKLTWNSSAFTLQEVTDQTIYSSPNQELQISLRPGDWKLLKFSTANGILTGLEKQSVEENQNDYELNLVSTLTQFSSFQSFQKSENRAGYYAVLDHDAYEVSPQDALGRRSFNAQVQSVDDGLASLYLGTESFGLKKIPIGGSINAPFAAQRNTGNVQELLIENTTAWTSLGYLGISAFDLSQSPISIAGHQGSLGTLSSLANDPNSNEIYAAYTDTGVFRHRISENDIESEFVLEALRVKDVSVSPNGDYAAIARMRRGFAVYKILEGGAFEEIATLNPTGETVEDIVWINDGLMMAGEWDGDVHAARLKNDNVEYVGMWNSDFRNSTLLDMVSADGDLIQGFRNGTVRRLNVDSVPQRVDEDLWFIY